MAKRKTSTRSSLAELDQVAKRVMAKRGKKLLRANAKLHRVLSGQLDPLPQPAMDTRTQLKAAQDEIIDLRRRLAETQNSLLQRVNSELTLRRYELILGLVDKVLRKHFNTEYTAGGAFVRGQSFVAKG